VAAIRHARSRFYCAIIISNGAAAAAAVAVQTNYQRGEGSLALLIVFI
jgi:hypothetical protein